MASSFQLVIDCAEPEPLARFWAAALGYELEPAPAGFGSRDEYWRDIGIPEDQLGIGADCIIDPAGRGPRIWFQVLPELNRKTGSISTWGRPGAVADEAARLARRGATVLDRREDHIVMTDPEGNEFCVEPGPVA